MAQKPVASPLTLELEPVVADLYKRHVEAAEFWYAHDYVPFDVGENFAFLGGRDWDPADVTLPTHITDALEILLITKDNLAGYHRELVEHFILEPAWGDWIGRWTAEENLHAIALREYLVVTREVDPVANEHVRVEHVMKGYRADHHTEVETLVFMALSERAHAVLCRRLAAQVEDPVLRGLVECIASDEESHEEFFAELVRACLRIVPDETIAAIVARAAELQVVGADIDAYRDKVKNVAAAGIFGEDQLREVISDRISEWNLAELPELSGFVLG
ncbi:acyl-ACP desaturase [Mycobacterium sp.]|jgi:acyl-[acyl-carrier-protein] desaturase|uniref:acyl-ACP desaturase n=1 Tax=Mycobacterium sp. TaxID=1785 RepID=UPI002D421FD4|nr:acyl-ACP desaturase [Mycobacterium sp.]HZA11689.1 acyl-ACP desaturase [Mycobacterium sp.]